MKKTHKKKISLVTGGAGFIGSHVAKHLLKMGHMVIVLDDLSGGYLENVPKQCVFIKGSIGDEEKLERIFKKYPIDYIFHLAAYAAEGLSHFIRKFNYENNVLGSINLINLAVNYGIKRFVFTSSIAVYGKNQLPMSEDLTLHPEDPYAIAKRTVELDLASAHEVFGLKYTIFRPHNVYGEGQNYGDPYRNVLGIFINNIMLKKPLVIFGDGKQKRAFTYINDVAPYIAESIKIKRTENQIYNLGSDKAFSVLYLAKLILKIMDSDVKIEFRSARKEVKFAYSDHSKIKKDFKIKKFIELQKGLSRMVEWSKKIGPRKTRKFKRIEIEKNLPSSWQYITG